MLILRYYCEKDVTMISTWWEFKLVINKIFLLVGMINWYRTEVAPVENNQILVFLHYHETMTNDDQPKSGDKWLWLQS